MNLLMLIAGLLPIQTTASTCVGPERSETVTVPGHPFAALSTNDGCWLFVSLETGNSQGAIAVLRNQAGRFSLDRVVPAPGHAFGEALSHDGKFLIVAAGTDTHVFDVNRLQQGGSDPILGTLHHGRKSAAIYTALTAGDKLLFVSEEDAKRIDVYDFTKMRESDFQSVAPSRHIPTASSPVGLAFSPDGRWLYATNEVGPAAGRGHAVCEPEMRGERNHPQGLLLVVDTEKAAVDPEHALVGAYPAGCNPVRVVASPNGKQVFVTARGDNRLLRFQVADWESGAEQIASVGFAIGKSPVGVAVRPDGKQVWVALSNRFGDDSKGQLAGLEDASTDTPNKLLSAPAPGFPREVGFLPDGQTIVATLFDGNQIEFVRTPN